MAKKQSNPIEVLREKGIDVDKLNMPPEVRTKYDAFKKELAISEVAYKKGLQEGKGSLARRAGGALLVNPVTKTLVLGGLLSYGALTGLKMADMNPSWLRAGQLDTASDATARWLRSWTAPKAAGA